MKFLQHQRPYFIPAICVLFLLTQSFAQYLSDKKNLDGGNTYYINSKTGNDAQSGLDPSQAWKTLGKVNNTHLQPGESLLFARNSIFTGQLKPVGSGNSEAPIVIGAYGTGDRPRLDAEGKYEATILLQNVEYYHVMDLEITNTGVQRRAGRKGIHLATSNFTAHNIHLDNLYIHDVNGSNVKSAGGGYGIHWSCSGSNARFDGLLIENCHLVRTDRNGITGWSDYCYPWWHWNPSTNVVIRNNLLEDIGGDGIVPIGTEGCMVEHNRLVGGRMRAQDYAAGIWPWGCKNTVIQYNEVSGMKGTKDGQAFDCDYECSGTIIQYNYSHDNEGGFLLVCAPSSSDYGCRDSIIRYNISQNDGAHSRIFHISGGSVLNTKIYNNTIYSDHNNILVKMDTWEGWPDRTSFYNNIFYVTGRAYNYWGEATRTLFENNVFNGTFVDAPENKNGMTDDPLLVDPGCGGEGFDSLDGYQLLENSPCIGAGKRIPNNGGQDFWGNPLNDNAPNIGAFAGDPVSGVDQKKINFNAPRELELLQNYPNPFNLRTTISYTIPIPSRVELMVYDIRGVKVKSIVDQVLNVGEYNTTFDASDLPSGAYLCKLTSGPVTKIRTMMFIK
ncbi:T9SS C-terminal target domain-containing protein [candidate division KSB1 bacterium]|nr:MAG: T9SS C-terminal target domain-containing protein [candidate division KSB1 bacterium]